MSIERFTNAFDGFGIPNVLVVSAAISSVLLALSLLGPLLGHPSRSAGLQRLPVLFFVFFWTIPNIYFSIAQQHLPKLGDFIFRHGSGALFVNFIPTWRLHRIEIRKGPGEPWVPFRTEEYFVTELPLNGNRLENYLLSLNGTESRDQPILESLMQQLAEKLEENPERVRRICAVRIVVYEYSVFTDPPLTRPVDMSGLELEAPWRRAGVLSSLSWNEQCADE